MSKFSTSQNAEKRTDDHFGMQIRIADYRYQDYTTYIKNKINANIIFPTTRNRCHANNSEHKALINIDAAIASFITSPEEVQYPTLLLL